MNFVKYVDDGVIKNEEWFYRGEGNAHLVIALPKILKVLRFKKVDSQNCADLFDYDRDLLFYTNIMGALLNPFVPDVNKVDLNDEEINKLNEDLKQFRPAFRIHKMVINKAELFKDFTLLPQNNGDTFSIEIKPKFGLLFESNCYFCNNQKEKLRLGKINKITSYCPLDLFSGDKEKMINAIKALLQNPQNNLNLFKNGFICYSENHKLSDLLSTLINMFGAHDFEMLVQIFCDLLINILLKPFKNVLIIQEHTCKEFKINQLPKNCVLERILKAQSYTKQIITNVNNYDYVKVVLDHLKDEANHCVFCILNSYLQSDDDLLKIIPEMIGKIAKDCSFMVTFKKKSNDIGINENVMQTNLGEFVFTVNILDLYPKLIKK